MNTDPLRRALRAFLPSSRGAMPKAIAVQHLGFDGGDLDSLPAALDEAGRALGLSLILVGQGGDVVLAERGFVARVAPQVLRTFLARRPLVTVDPAGASGADACQRARRLHAELVSQLQAIAAASEGATDDEWLSTLPPLLDAEVEAEPTSGGDRIECLELDPDRAELLNRLRRGLYDPTQPRLVAGYGPRAAVAIDFGHRRARVDDLAEQRLRVSRDVPFLAHGAEPGPRARVRDLDGVVWDIAFAAGDFRLLHEPAEWWRASLVAQPGVDVTRFSVQANHLELARLLAGGPVSPAELQRQGHMGMRELRGFLQAGLFLGLVRWAAAR